MATLPPWLAGTEPSSFTQAAAAGSGAGVSVGHLRQSALDSANRVALEAQALTQRASQAQAELAQQNVLAQMEMKARQDIAEKMRLHEQQQLEVQKAYHEGQVGLGLQKLEEAKAIARAKAEAAAAQFADNAALAGHLASGGKMAEGLYKYSRATPQFIKALQETIPGAEVMPQAANVGGMDIVVNPKSGHFVENKSGKIRSTQAYDPNNPDLGHFTRDIPISEAYKLAGTNAPNIFPGGVPGAAPAAAPQYRYNPQTRKIEKIGAPVTTQPVIDIPAFTEEQSQ